MSYQVDEREESGKSQFNVEGEAAESRQETKFYEELWKERQGDPQDWSSDPYG